MAQRFLARFLHLLARFIGVKNIDQADGDIYGDEDGKSRRQLSPPMAGARSGGRLMLVALQAAMHLSRGGELLLQFGIGDERALEIFPLLRREFSFQIIEEFFGRQSEAN